MQFVFSVGHCTLSMWCIPHYRWLSSCFLPICRVYSLQFVFLLEFFPRIMWCTPRYRGISSCFNLCGQLIRRFLASTLLLTGFPCSIYFMILFGCVLSSVFYPISYWNSFSRVDKYFSGTVRFCHLSFAPFSYYSEMSTRRSPRAPAPSNLAVQAAASSQPPRKRLRSSGPSSVSSLGGPSA